MTTAFETWLTKDRNALPEESVRLFRDSLKCYNAKIERPAYLLAYQGMLVHIREQLKKGNVPKGFTEGEWQNMLKEVSREEAWDVKVIDLVLKEEDINMICTYQIWERKLMGFLKRMGIMICSLRCTCHLII